ncbi:MAG: Na+/H+ antiporter subunit G [Rhodoferax sp.]
MNVYLEILISTLVLLGALLTFVGSIGLLRFKKFFQRLHAPTKATTMGIGSLLLASAIGFSALSQTISVHELLISLFLLITAPISAHMMARAAIVSRVDQLPDQDNNQAPDNQF